MSGFEKARIVARHEWSPGLITITLDQDGPDFTPGQFFQLGLTLTPPGSGETERIDANGDSSTAASEPMLIKRSYSAASAPGAPLQFFLSEVPGGKLTPGLFELNEGDEILVDPAPLGFFTLNEVPDCEELWLMATGTGLGPFISMVREGAALERFKRVNVVHGARHQSQLAYGEELQALGVDNGKIRYFPGCSQDEAPRGGFNSRLTQGVTSGALEKLAESRIDERSHVLLCGNPKMIEDMVALFRERGLSKHRRRTPGHFNFEKYW